ncbi:MAG TPA: DUF3341 domain-containing protein [Vicinamibacterales bacterium]|nr:DUF3341 domain-containing protein [Vicinamibacterales bacterium]
MPRTYLVATFADPPALVDAVRTVRAEGFKIFDVYSPCPVHGLDEAMGVRPSRLPYVTFVAAAAALAATIAFEFYAAVFDWPLNVGGKPDNSTLAFIPIAFEMTILAGGLTTAIAFLARRGLFPGAPARLMASGVTEDCFAVALRWRPNAFDTCGARRLLVQSGATRIIQIASDR